MNAPTPSAPLERFVDVVGPANAISDPADMRAYLVEPRDRFVGRTPLVLRPGTVAEVAAILKLANETRTGVVPQGGNTGVVGGQIPSETGGEVLVSLSRLNRIRALDPDNNTMTAEAGVVLAAAQATADEADRLLPLSLASEGTCQIGGNLSTNAGGTGVLAYGNVREMVLGLEVVLPTGEVWDGLRTLRKDNTGYDLKDLFIGAEGTLGIITAAVLKLAMKPRGVAVAFLGVPNPSAALAVLKAAQGRAGKGVTGCEIIARIGIDAVIRHVPGTRKPLAGDHDWFVLLEISSGLSQEDADATVEAIFADAAENNLVEDGALAESIGQREAFWRIRHALSEIQKLEGGSIKHDVAVPVSAVPDFLEKATAAVSALVPGARPFPFGHLGDGNIHFNISQPIDMDKQVFLDRWDEVNAIVHAVVLEFGGTISAEHGIGRMKRRLLPEVKSAVEIDLMRRIKTTLDPNGIMNPGKVL